MATSIRELLSWGERELSGASENPQLDARILLAEILNISQTHLVTLDQVSSEQAKEFEAWIIRRKNCEPIQYITTRAYFRSLTLAVGPGVLIPRPESELLVDAVIEYVKTRAQLSLNKTSVADFGAGSGALAISIATELPGSAVIAVESEPQALSWLEKNVAMLAPQVQVVQSNVQSFDGLGKFDVVIANPPYIPAGQSLPSEVREFEPATSLFGGENGLEVPALFIDSAQKALRPGGFLALEHHESHSDEIANLLKKFFDEVTLHYDLNNRPRWSSGVRK